MKIFPEKYTNDDWKIQWRGTIDQRLDRLESEQRGITGSQGIKGYPGRPGSQGDRGETGDVIFTTKLPYKKIKGDLDNKKPNYHHEKKKPVHTLPKTTRTEKTTTTQKITTQEQISSTALTNANPTDSNSYNYRLSAQKYPHIFFLKDITFII